MKERIVIEQLPIDIDDKNKRKYDDLIKEIRMDLYRLMCGWWLNENNRKETK